MRVLMDGRVRLYARVALLLMAFLVVLAALITTPLVKPAQAAHLPIRIIRFQNIGNDANINTGVSSSTHHCVATGWSAHWDIQEHDAGSNYVWTQVQPTLQGNRWFLRVSFRSHNNHESPDVDVLCFPTDVATFTGPTALFDPD